MSATALDALRTAIEQRWAEDDFLVAPSELISLGQADVERPPSLKIVLELRRVDAVHAVIALMLLDKCDLAGESFTRVRDDVRATAHYVASHVNPPSLADVVHLWAVAPIGNQDVEAWRQLRQELHQDTWSVPKSVWLPDSSLDTTEFLEQGLLARPWDFESQDDAESLDLIDRLRRRLGSLKEPWEPERVRQLLDTLGDEATPADASAASLIALAEEFQ